MAFRLRSKDRSVEQGLRRIAREQVDGALKAIADGDAARATHTVRKACKKVRALVRLVRPAFAAYSDENAAFRDLARGLSGSRDAKVLHDTAERLLREAPDRIDGRRIRPLRQALAEMQAQQSGDCGNDALALAGAALEEARGRIGDWSLDAGGWDALEGGLVKVYRKGRKAAAGLAPGDGIAAHHEVRKLVKYHWYHLRLLQPLWPPVIRARAGEASALGDLLGLHHDIAVLAGRLEAGGSLAGHGGADILLDLAVGRGAAIERKLGRPLARLYAQSPDALGEHWHALWQVWRG